MGSLLIIFGCGDEKKAVQMVPWNVIIMVLGVGILMNVISLSGGIDIMVAALEHVMSKRTAAMIMRYYFWVYVLLQFRSWSCIPDSDSDSKRTGFNAGSRCHRTGIGDCNRWNDRRISSISTTGALIMAGVSQQENAENVSRRTVCL